MATRKETAREVRERVRRLKNKFVSLSKVERLREYVRYERAATGVLAHRLPTEYVNEVFMALEELLMDDFENDRRKLERWLDVIRRSPSRPFT